MGDDSIAAGPRSPLKLRVFISSPADVEEERGIARAVLRRLEKEPQFEGRIELDEVSYDDPDDPASMEAHLTFQSAINQSKPKPSACDVVVIILWSRLGSEILDTAYLKPDGSGHFTGTEWEFGDGVRASEEGSDTSVWVFRRRKAFSPSRPDDSEQLIEDKRRQEDKIRAFFKTSVKSYWWYAPPPGVAADESSTAHQDAQFDFLLGSHLRKLIWDRLRATGMAQPASPDERDERIAERTWPAHLGSPFRALEPFTSHYAPVFHGREAELDALLQDVASKPFVAVLGQSGSGKSSLVYAGLLPALAEGRIPGSAAWPVISFKPGELSGGPLESLADELKTVFAARGWRTSELAKRLRARPDSIVDLAAEALSGSPSNTRLLIFIDQFEEVFARPAASDADEEAALRARRLSTDRPLLFAVLRAAVSADSRIRVVIAMRSDFCGHWPQDDASVALFNAGQRMLGRPGQAALERIIRAPARAAGLRIADSLVNAIIGEAGSEPGALPLLEFVLSRLYERRSPDNELTEEAYRDIGGLTGAINDWAERAIRDADGSVHVAALNRLFQAIASVQNIDGKRTAVRKRAPVSSLDADALAIAHRLIAARLLVTGSDQTPYVEVAHEALFARWATLSTWLHEHGEALQLLRHMQAEAEAWQADPGTPLHQPWPAEAQTLAYQALTRLGRTWDNETDPLRSFLRPEALRLIDELDNDELDHFRRATIGERLATIGDPRPGIGVHDGTPDIVWHDIAEGTTVLIAEDGQAMARCAVAPFRIARYPVTWRQFQAFLDADDGYDDPRWWTDLVPAAVRPQNRYPQFSNHPASRVSWFDAVAFCRWLSVRLATERPAGWEIRLPLEWEWQLAAGGGDASRDYPWGPWSENRANTAESGLGRIIAVGLYPRGTWHGSAGPGPLDMAGEVLEWCANHHNLAVDMQGRQGEESQRALRGGSWRIDHDLARCTARLGDHPRGRYPSVGFRLCCAPPLTPASFSTLPVE